MCTWMSLYHMCAWNPQKSEKDIRFIGTKVTDVCEVTYGSWKLNTALYKSRIYS